MKYSKGLEKLLIDISKKKRKYFVITTRFTHIHKKIVGEENTGPFPILPYGSVEKRQEKHQKDDNSKYISSKLIKKYRKEYREFCKKHGIEIDDTDETYYIKFCLLRYYGLGD